MVREQQLKLSQLYQELAGALARDDREHSKQLQLEINALLGVKYCPSCGRALPLEKT